MNPCPSLWYRPCKIARIDFVRNLMRELSRLNSRLELQSPEEQDTKAPSLAEASREILGWADRYERARNLILERMNNLANVRAEIESIGGISCIAAYSKYQQELSELLAQFYVTLKNTNEAIDQFQQLYDSLNLQIYDFNEQLKKYISAKEIHLFQTFRSDQYRQMFDYDQEIEKLNDVFDRLVRKKSKSRKFILKA